jgi:hypothetical protein
MLKNKYKLVSSGTFATKLLTIHEVNKELGEKLSLLLATNKGYIKLFNISSIL